MNTVAHKTAHKRLKVELPKISLLFLLLFCDYSAAKNFNYEICYDPINLESRKVINEYLQGVDSKLVFQENVHVSQCAYAVGMFKKTLKFVDFALSESPTAYEPLTLKANALFNLNRFQDAEKILSRMYENEMAEVEDVQLLADVLVRLDRGGKQFFFWVRS